MTYLAVICGLQLALIAWLLHDRQAERREVARERGDLLLRIQAPQQAIIERYNVVTPEATPRAVTPEDDEDFWESREALADRLAEGELTRGVEVNGNG